MILGVFLCLSEHLILRVKKKRERERFTVNPFNLPYSVSFLKTWCDPCLAEMLRGSGIRVLCGPTSKAKSTNKQYQRLRVLKDQEGKALEDTVLEKEFTFVCVHVCAHAYMCAHRYTCACVCCLGGRETPRHQVPGLQGYSRRAETCPLTQPPFAFPVSTNTFFLLQKLPV